MSCPAEIEVQIQRYYQSLSEKDRRRYAGIAAIKVGHGGIAYISRVLGCDYRTLQSGMPELQDTEDLLDESGIRHRGGGPTMGSTTIPQPHPFFCCVRSRKPL